MEESNTILSQVFHPIMQKSQVRLFLRIWDFDIAVFIAEYHKFCR